MSSNIRIARICQHCGKKFEAKTTVTKSCSDLCAKRLYKAKQKEKKIETSNQETKTIINKPIEDLKELKYLTVEQAAKLLSMSRRTIYRLHERGQLQIHKIGGCARIQNSDIDKLFIPKP